MKLIRKLFFFVFLALLLWLGIFSYNRVTDGFSVRQMSSSLPAYPQYQVTLNEEKKGELRSLLDQEFRYLGKGCQFYVFESADHTCVIKFLKHKHLRPFTWLNALPMLPKWRALSQAKIERRKERVERLFSSCKLAYEKMPQETGLLFIHLDRVPALETEITLFDKLGRKHTIALDRYEYVIQKKALPLKELFAHLSREEAAEKAKQLEQLVLLRCEKGIADRDRSFAQNVAFTPDGQYPLFVDIGQFYEDPSLLQPEAQQKEIEKRLANLHHWIQKHFPHLLPDQS